jgi:hypothetical protein
MQRHRAADYRLRGYGGPFELVPGSQIRLIENAPVLASRGAGLAIEQPCAIAVSSRVVGMHAVHLLVEDKLLVEPKAAQSIDHAHCTRCISPSDERTDMRLAANQLWGVMRRQVVYSSDHGDAPIPISGHQ